MTRVGEAKLGETVTIEGVTGRVIERADLPVVAAPRPGEPIPAGISVPPGADPARAARRFLLADATWKLLE